MAPRSTQRPFRMTVQTSYGLLNKAGQTSSSFMWASCEVSKVHKGGGGGDFRPLFIRTLTMTFRLSGHPCNDNWIVSAPEEMGPAKGTAEVISQ